MAGFTERLQILIDGNASGAIREFEKVGAAADRELGRTEDKLERLSNRLTGIGTGLLAGGAVAVTGLKQLADSASAYSEQVSAATVTFGEEGAAQLEAFAAAAADTANISKTEATKAANSFATFARQAGLTGESAVKFSTDLVQLAGDISSFRDISVADALAALQSGLAGEGEPIRRLGGDISEVALKAEYLALTGEEVTGSLTTQQKVLAINSKLFKDFELAQGDVIRTSDSLANQTRNAQAEFENLKIELGEQLTPVFATVVGGISDIISKFQELPDGTRDTAATLAGLGAFGATAVGALSLVAGQAIKFRDAFTNVTTSVVDGVETSNRSLSRLGRVAVGGAAIVGVIGLIDALKQAQVDTDGLRESLDELATAGSNDIALDALLDSTSKVDGWFDDFVEAVGPGIGDVIDINGVTVELEDLREVLARLETEQLEKALTALKEAEVSKSLTSSPFAIDNLRNTIGEYEEKLTAAKAKQQETNAEIENFAGAATDAQPPAEVLLTTVEGLAVKTDEAKNAFQAYSDVLKANTDPFFAVIDAAGGLADAQQKVAEAYIALFTDGATAQEFVDLADAQRDAVGAAVGLESTIAALRGEVEDGNITYGSAIETLDILAQKYPALAAPGGPIDQVKQEFFFAALAAKGLADASPVDVQVNASGTDETIKRLNNVVAVLQTIQSINAVVAAAADVAERVAAEANAANRNDILFQEIVGNRDLNGNGIIGRAIGGPVAKGQAVRVGEEGPELFVPRVPGRIISNGQLQMGGPQIIQNITTPDPLQTAAEVVRRQRDAEFLAGV